MLATYSFLPIIKAFTDAAGVAVETRDISLSGRVLAYFKDSLIFAAGTFVLGATDIDDDGKY